MATQVLVASKLFRLEQFEILAFAIKHVHSERMLFQYCQIIWINSLDINKLQLGQINNPFSVNSVYFKIYLWLDQINC